jgi:hypothetical protein
MNRGEARRVAPCYARGAAAFFISLAWHLLLRQYWLNVRRTGVGKRLSTQGTAKPGLLGEQF